MIAWHVTIAPSWFDPSTAPPQITPFGMLYALHDALVRPLPGQKMGNALAESWTESPDGLRYEFKLRRGLKFHNGDPVTTEDVKFSFERYKGAGSTELQAHVRQVEIVDPLTHPLPPEGAVARLHDVLRNDRHRGGLVVPKKYLTQVGDDGFRKHPDRRRPVSSSSATSPGVEVVLEAYPGYWRRAPNVKRVVMKSVPEGTSRVAMLKNGEADIAYALDGEDAENVRRDPRLSLVPSKHASIYWIEFGDQWDPKSPWADKRMRLAVNYALNRKAINEVACLGFCPPAWVIVPRVMDFALPDAGRALRPHQGQAAPRRGRLSQRDRRRRVRADAAVLHGGRGRAERSERGRHPAEDAHRWSAPPSSPPGGEEAARAVPRRGRELGQCRQPRGSVHLFQGQLRLRRLSRHRRPLPCSRRASATWPSARPCSTRSSSSPSIG
mgnify:CR=1 FL=1